MKDYLRSYRKLLLSLLLLWWGQAIAGSGVVLGTVMNASRDSVAMVGQEVVLYQYVDGQEVEGPRAHTVTDGNGRFVFDELEVSERFSYYPLTVLAGIEFSGEAVQPSPASLRQRSDILVFEPTTSDSAITAAMHHVIVEPGVSAISVRETILFVNRGKYTYVGNTPSASNKNIVLRFAAPQEAEDLQLGGNVMSCCIVVNDNQVFDTMELKPGTRQVVMTYHLPYQGNEIAFTKAIAFPTEMLDIYLPAPLRLSASTIKREGDDGESNPALRFDGPEPFQIRDKNYARYQVTNVAENSRISLAITDLPAAPNDYRWLAPVALVLVIIIGYVLHHRRKASQQPAQPAPGQQPATNDARRQMIQRVLQLDEKLEAGKIDKATYRLEREKLVEAVLAMDGEDGDSGTEEVHQDHLENEQ